MCGIAGMWTSRRRSLDAGNVTDVVAAMAGALQHRGPDGGGVWTAASGDLALGHRRLAIIDLSPSGAQPMSGPSGTTTIVFNGEIYNYVELRAALVAEGVRFRSTTDTEVILALYEKHGDDCVRMLRGMFAFALWDARQRRLLVARDRIGKKPLYYARRPGWLAFASELKALRVAFGSDVPQLDAASINRYLSFGCISGPGTVYRDVYQLPPGSTLVATASDRVEIRTYWSPDRTSEQARDVTIDEVEDKLIEAVRIRLRSDVPVATFLSGGIDSGLVTAMATRLNGPLAAFTVGFEDGQFDERPLARQVARRYGVDHHEITVRPDVARLLPEIVRAYDQPYADASCVPAYCVAQAVSGAGYKVVLNGDGGDELFGGYRRALAAAWLSRLHGMAGPAVTRTIAGAALALLGEPAGHRGARAFLQRFLRGAAAGDVRRLLIWSTDSFTADERRDLGIAPYDEAADVHGLLSYVPPGAGPLASMMAIDLKWALPYDLLVKMDIATMAHGLEARSPLLDQDLVEMQTRRPIAGLLPGFTTKPVLRALARKYLPADVVTAPKRGFEPPLERWMTGELTALRDDLLLAPDGLLATIVDRAKLEAFVRRPPAGDTFRWAHRAWILLSLAAWDRFVARERVQPLGLSA
jgi:asparagine synthase (glutamine-hydrolysing)